MRSGGDRVLAQAQHADVHRVQVAGEVAGAFGAHAIVAHGLELEPGRDAPKSASNCATRGTPSLTERVIARPPWRRASPLEPSRPPDSTDARDRRRATASPRRRASARMASRRTRRGGTILLSGRAIDRKSAISVLRAAVQSSQLRMRLTSPIVRGPTSPVRSSEFDCFSQIAAREIGEIGRGSARHVGRRLVAAPAAHPRRRGGGERSTERASPALAADFADDASDEETARPPARRSGAGRTRTPREASRATSTTRPLSARRGDGGVDGTPGGSASRRRMDSASKHDALEARGGPGPDIPEIPTLSERRVAAPRRLASASALVRARVPGGGGRGGVGTRAAVRTR